VPFRRSKTVLGGWGAAVLLAASALAVGGGGTAVAATCTTTPSDRVPGVRIRDPACGFTPDAGAAAYTGILHGSAYRIEVPDHWNGDLVMYAHGYAGTGTTVSVSSPQLAKWYVDHGYAWAASSYRQNGYDVGDGVEDTHDLMTHFSGLTHHRAPRDTYMTGVSMGGEITAVGIEQYRGQYTAAMPMCGVLGANHLFDYFLGADATAFALTGTDLQYPTTADAGAAYQGPFDQAVHSSVLPGLGYQPPTRTAPVAGFTTTAGQQWLQAVTQLSGGTRPGLPGAVRYWSSFGFAPLTDIPFLFGVYPGLTGGTIGYADGNVADNTGTTYQLDGDPAVSPDEEALNQSVIRVAATNTATTDAHRTELPDIAGDPRIPVLSLHDIGDLFVPLSMDQIYAEQVAAHGSDLFVDRAIRGTGHCEFSTDELAAGFSDLVSWAHTGAKPAGDAILDPKAVADPSFGCRFTDPAFTHLWFGDPCPAVTKP
jgi:hypothetical protein